MSRCLDCPADLGPPKPGAQRLRCPRCAWQKLLERKRDKYRADYAADRPLRTYHCDYCNGRHWSVNCLMKEQRA
jgi:C4-type Zn-finger protein